MEIKNTNQTTTIAIADRNLKVNIDSYLLDVSSPRNDENRNNRNNTGMSQTYEGMRTCKGAFNVSCATCKEPGFIMNEM